MIGGKWESGRAMDVSDVLGGLGFGFGWLVVGKSV